MSRISTTPGLGLGGITNTYAWTRTSKQTRQKFGSTKASQKAKTNLDGMKTEKEVTVSIKKLTQAQLNYEAEVALYEDLQTTSKVIKYYKERLIPRVIEGRATIANVIPLYPGGSETTDHDVKLLRKWKQQLLGDEAALEEQHQDGRENQAALEQSLLNQKRLKLRAENPIWWDEGVKYRGGKISATVLSGILAVGFILWAMNSQAGWVKFGSDTAPTPEVIHKPPPAVMMKEWCEDLHAAASQYEGSAQGDLAPETWNMHLDSLRPAWTVAYAEATRLGIQNMTQPPVVGWNMPAPFLNQTLTPGAVVHASIADQAKIAAQRQKDSDTQDLIAVIRPIYLRHEFTQSFADEIHEIAFRMMKNSTGLPYPTESHYFDKAYAAMFWRMDISSDCAGYINEGKRITAQYKTARALQVVRHSDLKVAVDLHLDAKSALPPVPLLV